MSWNFVKASWKGGTKFVIENRRGSKNTITVPVPSGEETRHFAPGDAFLAAIASCAGTNVVMLLLDREVAVKSFTVKAESIIRTIEPRSYEKIHLIFQVAGDVDEEVVRDCVTRSVTLLCPIAVTVGKNMEMTWDLQVTRTLKAGSRR